MNRLLAHLLLGVLLVHARIPDPLDVSLHFQQEGQTVDAADSLSRRLEKAKRTERAELLAKLEALVAEQPTARESLERALRTRCASALASLTHSKTRGSLEGLIGRRHALDEARAHALELILDEKRFFYPFAGPQVEPDRARSYNEVRADVLARIDAVRAIWTEKTRIPLPTSVRDAWDELAWLRSRSGRLGIDLALPADAPAWLFAQNARLEALTVREIALDTADAAALDRDRAIVARNEALWAAQPGEGAAVPNLLEREEIRLTNEYRRMMGRRALAWDPRLQESARTHSEYMAETGDFGHLEPTHERGDPFARMQLFGYPQGISENCYAGTAVPLAAHDGWLGSSMHHRGILDTRATEMGTGMSKTYWTQDFGSDCGFEADLGRW
jgi:uncharacterized protein YkwD